ncbi:MAG: hypothetical protein S4CHLAM6_06250 [Chlamydiae bacterium]|nr:hypothetical protein [Chlamydiota bacterium]
MLHGAAIALFIQRSEIDSMHGQLVEQICKLNLEVINDQTGLDQKIISYLLKKKVNPLTLDLKITVDSDALCELDNFRALFKASLIVFFEKCTNSTLIERWHELASNRSADSQLAEAYLILTAHMLGIAYTGNFHVNQLKNGIIPLSKKNYWNLLKFPFIHLHAELATVLILIGKLTQQPKLVNQGYLAAKWHFNSLGSDFLPFKGFFSNYQFCNYPNLVSRQASFLYLAALAMEDPEMAYVAKAHFSYLLNQSDNKLKETPLDILLLMRWTDFLFPQQLTPIEPTLEAKMECKNLPLIGVRSTEMDIITTLSGCNSSMGSLRFGDIEIAAFGPQVGELGDGKFFGSIAQKPSSESFEVYEDGRHSCIKGLVGLPLNNPEVGHLKSWQHPAGWLEVKFLYQKKQLDIHIKPIEPPDSLYFVFYIIADQCLIKGQKKFLNNSLDQFQGPASNIAFLDKSKLITIEPSAGCSDMKIIPLEGESSFWGANYLVAYPLKNNFTAFDWKVTSSFR